MSTLNNNLDKRLLNAILTPQDYVVDAINNMYMNDANFVILQDGFKTVGIFTHGDLKNRVIAINLDPTKIKLLDVMTTDLKLFDINDTLNECLSKIGKKKIGHLPILCQGKLVAVLSTLRLLQMAFQELVEERRHLIFYITGEVSAI